MPRNRYQATGKTIGTTLQRGRHPNVQSIPVKLEYDPATHVAHMDAPANKTAEGAINELISISIQNSVQMRMDQDVSPAEL